MKIKLLTLSFLSLLAISQLSFINSKNSLFTSKEIENPYMPYGIDSTTFSGKSIDIMDQNNNNAYAGQNGTAIAYFQVIDNSTNDYFNFITNLSSTERTMTFNLYDHNGGYYNTDTFFYPSLSNIKNNDTYYVSFLATANRSLLSKFLNFGYAIGSPTSEPTNGTVKLGTVNNDSSSMAGSHINHYAPIDIFPFISPYSDENNDVFQMNSISENGGLVFTIKVDNWMDDGVTDYLQQEDTIGVTLINEDEPDEYLKYEQYQAHLVKNDGGYYTYKVDDLSQDINYSFYSINFTGLTVGSEQYYPDFDIRLTDELNIPKSMTTLYVNPYIDPSVVNFSIDLVTATSIEFSLKIIDTSDKYLSLLTNTDNTMDVTIRQLSTQKDIKTEAKFVSEDNGMFTFEITGLDSRTNYEIISLDNTELMINGEIKSEIYLVNDLNVTESEATFKTKSNAIFVIFIILIILIILAMFGLTLTYFMKQRKGKEAEKAGTTRISDSY